MPEAETITQQRVENTSFDCAIIVSQRLGFTRLIKILLAQLKTFEVNINSHPKDPLLGLIDTKEKLLAIVAQLSAEINGKLLLILRKEEGIGNLLGEELFAELENAQSELAKSLLEFFEQITVVLADNTIPKNIWNFLGSSKILQRSRQREES